MKGRLKADVTSITPLKPASLQSRMKMALKFSANHFGGDFRNISEDGRIPERVPGEPLLLGFEIVLLPLPLRTNVSYRIVWNGSAPSDLSGTFPSK